MALNESEKTDDHPPATDPPQAKKSLKKRKVKSDAENTPQVTVLQAQPIAEVSSKLQDKKKNKKDKKRKAEELEQNSNDAEEEQEAEQRENKKLKTGELNQEDEPSASQPKKKRKNKTGFPDPEEDASLSDQSRKALGYVFMQFRRPSKWKFNKARQNWLIRNIWSIESIPEIYQPMVLKYLSNVKGGIRENLIKICRSILDDRKGEPAAAASDEAEAGESVAANVIVSPSPPEEVKKARAAVLLEILNSTADA